MSEKKVTVRQEGKEDKVIDAPEGAVFLQVLKMNGYSLVCCNGKGTCGRCRIRFCGNGAPLPGAADRIAFTGRNSCEADTGWPACTEYGRIAVFRWNLWKAGRWRQ